MSKFVDLAKNIEEQIATSKDETKTKYERSAASQSILSIGWDFQKLLAETYTEIIENAG